MGATTTTREKPIIFSGEMARAILAGRKSQTRRLVKPRLGPEAKWVEWEGDYRAQGLLADIPVEWRSKLLCCPYQPGMRLWVRETWAELDDEWGCPIIAWKAGSARVIGAEGERRDGSWRQYIIHDSIPGEYEVQSWRSPIRMPRWASRLTLEVTDVRCERLQEITPDDLTAEGFPPDNSPPHDGTRLTFHGRKMCFAELWDELHGKVSWDSNPWVWAITFRKLES